MPELLNSEQITYGSGPQLTAAQREALADLMQEIHCRQMQRVTFGLVTCIARSHVITCALLGRIPMLVFREDSTTIEEDLVERRWRIISGWTLRAGSDHVGVMTVGVRLRLAVANRTNWTAWIRVDDFPSRFLGLGEGTRLRPIGRLIGAIYRNCHAWVGRGYLKRLACRLDTGDIPGHG